MELGDITWSRDATTFAAFYWRQVTSFDVFPFLVSVP
jgi:hypothetical protein